MVLHFSVSGICSVLLCVFDCACCKCLITQGGILSGIGSIGDTMFAQRSISRLSDSLRIFLGIVNGPEVMVMNFSKVMHF